MTNAPKLLPWYARRVGISEQRAIELWQNAVAVSTADTDLLGTDKHWHETNKIFLQLLHKERASLCYPTVQSLVRNQQKLWRWPLDVLESNCIWQAKLQRQWSQRIGRSR